MSKHSSLLKRISIVIMSAIICFRLIPSFDIGAVNGNAADKTYFNVGSNAGSVTLFDSYASLYGARKTDPNGVISSISYASTHRTATIYFNNNYTTDYREATIVFVGSNGNAVRTVYLTQEPHTHSWGSWITTKEPKCTECGSKYHRCSSCGATETKVITPNGHSFETISQTSPTCTKAGSITMNCKYCHNYKFTTSTARAKGHKYSYSYNKSTGKIVGTCTRSGCYSQDLDVTYKEFLDYEANAENSYNKLPNNRDSQKKYLTIMAANIKGVSIDDLLDDKAVAESQFGGKLGNVCDKCGEALGFIIDATQPGLESFSNYDEVSDALRSASTATEKLVNVYDGISTASTLTDLMECNNMTPKDFVSYICSAATLGDSFGVLSKGLKQMPDLFESSVTKAQKYEDYRFFCDYLSDEDKTVKIAGVEKPLYKVSLYDIYEYQFKIREVIGGDSVDDNNKRYRFLKESKQAYVSYLLSHPSYSGDYEEFCQYIFFS